MHNKMKPVRIFYIIILYIVFSACQDNKIEVFEEHDNEIILNKVMKKQKKDVVTIKEVQLGEQVWMQKNLDVSVFQNGDSILHAKTKSEWDYAAKHKIPAWCYYANKKENDKKYGKLYNFYAVNSKKGLAPSGWRIPNDNDWKVFINFFGGLYISSSNKIMSKTFWNGIHDDGFNAVAGGGRFYNGFHGINDVAYFWSSSSDRKIDKIVDAAFCFMLSNSLTMLTSFSQDYGLSVRCIKDTLAN